MNFLMFFLYSIYLTAKKINDVESVILVKKEKVANRVINNKSIPSDKLVLQFFY